LRRVDNSDGHAARGDRVGIVVAIRAIRGDAKAEDGGDDKEQVAPAEVVAVCVLLSLVYLHVFVKLHLGCPAAWVGDGSWPVHSVFLKSRPDHFAVRETELAFTLLLV
jgi:hypothetical protein